VALHILLPVVAVVVDQLHQGTWPRMTVVLVDQVVVEETKAVRGLLVLQLEHLVIQVLQTLM
tara:strand:+ start:397 stop:582 length:186 start_codon:yes stop_codon:yes gene_type:complete